MTDKYRELFFEETDEYLQKLNDYVLQLEEYPEDKEILNEIFRAAHTLKGMAATMGYNTMTELTHSMENVFDLFKSKKIKVDSDIISLIFKSLDKLSEIVEDLKEDKKMEYDISGLLDSLNNVGKNKEKSEIKDLEYDPLLGIDGKLILKAKNNGYNSFRIIIKVDKECLLKGPRAYLVINKMKKYGDVVSTSPKLDDLEKGNYKDKFQVIYITKLDKEESKEVALNNSEINKVEVIDILEDDINRRYEKKENKLIRRKDIKNKNKKSQLHINRKSQSIRVDIDRLDSMMNLVSELVIYRTRLEDIAYKHRVSEIDEPLSHVAKITSELQDLVLKIRMQPLEVVLSRFPRMIRDLSQELNKDIKLIIEGEDTELDRTVVSELGEPLIHLIRNAADHGIEDEKRRLQLGKDKTGLIKISAYQEGNRVVITVSDDGKGLDPIKIKKTAEKKGINTKNLDDKELVNLIFSPGFSTMENVTNVSGRGVGMDVVRSNIKKLGGSIEVFSQLDVGTRFVIKLPLTLSIIQALLVEVGEEIFAIPLGLINRVVKLEKDKVQKSHNLEVYKEKGRMIPLIRVNEKLNIKDTKEEHHIILVSLGEKIYGLIVNRLVGEQEIVIKKLGRSLSHKDEYLGATILGNGDIILILDISNLCHDKGDKDA